MYFLCILLYIVSLCAILLENDQARMKTVMYLEKENASYPQEAHVISLIRSQLQEGEVESAGEIPEGSYTCQVYPAEIDVTIDSKQPEKLILELSADGKKIEDFRIE